MRKHWSSLWTKMWRMMQSWNGLVWYISQLVAPKPNSVSTLVRLVWNSGDTEAYVRRTCWSMVLTALLTKSRKIVLNNIFHLHFFVLEVFHQHSSFLNYGKECVNSFVSLSPFLIKLRKHAKQRHLTNIKKPQPEKQNFNHLDWFSLIILHSS